MKSSNEPDAGAHRDRWLNREVVGMGVASLLSDASHEMATAVLPGFFAVLGISPAALGAIEGIADATSSFVKLGSGWISDRLGRRKPAVVGGYVLTGVSQALFALAHGWPWILAGRTVGWFGRGVRSPLRNAMLANSVGPEDRGKAFGFHRAADTIGAIIGPLLGVWLLADLGAHASNPTAPFRFIFLLTLIPGLGAGIAFACLVREKRAAPAAIKLWKTVKSLPREFWHFLSGVGIFGMGNFARTLMILAATDLLAPGHGIMHAAEIAGLLYASYNVVYAAFSYPAGALSDRVGRRGLLAAGYMAGALAAAGFLAAFVLRIDGIAFLLALFALSGISSAVVDALEGAATADFITDDSIRGTAYGVLGAVNGAGDLIASIVVGALWSALSPTAAFAYAGALMAAGAAVLWSMS